MDINKVQMFFDDIDFPTPEDELVMAVIKRAFFDAVGTCGAVETTTTNKGNRKKRAISEARNFILNKYKINWGDLELDCRELCFLLTGDNSLWKILSEYVRKEIKLTLVYPKSRILQKVPSLTK